MDWQGHSLLGLRAAQGLPAWEIEMLKPDMSPAEIGKSIMPKITNTVEKLGAYCLMLDWVYQPEYAKYCRLENGRWIPHGPAGPDFAASNSNVSETANNILITTLLQGMIDELKAGHWEEAVRRGGALGHFLQEPFTPGHSTDNALFEQFFPDPNPLRHWRLHFCFDSANGDYPPPVPELAGTTAAEAAFHLFNYIKKGIISARALIGPVVQAAYRGETLLENQKVFKALLNEQSRKAAYVTACAWHTAFCIAFNRFEQPDVKRLEEYDLTDALPYFMHPSLYVHIIPNKLVDNRGYLIPIDVWGENKREVHFEHGFGMYGHSGYKYYINGQFSRFRFKLGMPSRDHSRQNEYTDLCFSIETDTRENLLFSEDIEYGAAARPLEVQLKAFAPVREYEVDIRGAATMIISSRCIPYTSPDGIVMYACPNLAVIDPVLVK